MKPRISQALLSLLVAALVAFLLWIKQHSSQDTHRSAPSPASKASKWETLSPCHLVTNHNNDGDSFVVSHEGRTHTFRLYFVDCPETHLRRDNGDRLEDQAHYFQLPSPEAAASVGQAATAFVDALLQRPFTVVTHWERVFDSQRFYAQVIVQTDAGASRDLAELLVEHGYARIFTKGANLPHAVGEGQFKQRLHALESASRAAQKGAWK